MIMKALKTGHIRVPINFKCNIHEAKDIRFWNQNIKSGKAIFLSMAFSVETTSTSRSVHVKSAYKNQGFDFHLKEGSLDCSIIEVYQNGYLGFGKYEDETIFAHNANTYQVLPFENRTESVTEQQKIIYEYDSVLDPVFIMPDFNPIHIVKY